MQTGSGRFPGEGNTPVFLPVKLLPGQRSLAGNSPQSRKESETTVQLSLSLSVIKRRPCAVRLRMSSLDVRLYKTQISSICHLPTQHLLTHLALSRVWLHVTPQTVAQQVPLSVHGILQARILQQVAIPFSKGSSWPRDRTWVSWITGKFLTI